MDFVIYLERKMMEPFLGVGVGVAQEEEIFGIGKWNLLVGFFFFRYFNFFLDSIVAVKFVSRSPHS